MGRTLSQEVNMNNFSKKQIKGPAKLPIDLDMVKMHLKILHTDEDQLLMSYIRAVTRTFESHTGRILIEQEWQVIVQKFIRQSITLPVRPAKEILRIEMLDSQGNHSFFHPQHYYLEEGSSELFFGIAPLCQALKIHCKCGYGLTPEEMPAEITAALLHHISFMYENRESPISFDLSIYDQFKNMRV